jgi:uncharacterized ion transporter superfamily protein YfcC
MAKSRFPHPLVLLTACVLLAAVLSYVLPAGRYERHHDPRTGREVVLAGTYHAVPAHHVTFFETMVGVPQGMADAASVIFLVFLVGGAFTVVDETGALKHGVGWLVGKLDRREALAIPIVCVLFITAGALENTSEEIIALVPVLLLLARRLGFRPLVAVAMSLGAAAVGAAFSPINPFQVGIAQKVAGVALLSGLGFRLATLVIASAIWIWGTVRYAVRTRVAPAAEPGAAQQSFHARQLIVLAIVLAAFGIFVYGVMRRGWDFDQMSALFFVMGVLAGLVGGLGLQGTANGFASGFGSMAMAAMLIGFARAIYVVLTQGQIIDTIVHGAADPLSHLPVAASALGMIVFHSLVHVPVPSVSGQAVLTMPVLTPIADLIGLSRQVAVLAYQFGAGLCELLTPTNGALMAILVAADVKYEEWLKFAGRMYAVLLAFGAVAVMVAIAVGVR